MLAILTLPYKALLAGAYACSVFFGGGWFCAGQQGTLRTPTPEVMTLFCLHDSCKVLILGIGPKP